MIKYLVLVCAFIAYNGALISQTEQTDAVQLCVNQTRANPKSVFKLTNKLQIPKNDPAIKSFLECFYKLVGLQDQDGNMLFEKIRVQLKNDFIKFETQSDIIIQRCVGVKGNSHEENAYLATDCILKNIRRLSNAGNKKPKKN